MTPSKDSIILLKKAQEDLTLLNKIQNDQDITDAIFGFHAQQALEKITKSLLQFCKIDFPRTHDLMYLMELVPSSHKKLFSEVEDLNDELTPYAVTFRYDVQIEEPLDRNKIFNSLQKTYELVKNYISS